MHVITTMMTWPDAAAGKNVPDTYCCSGCIHEPSTTANHISYLLLSQDFPPHPDLYHEYCFEINVNPRGTIVLSNQPPRHLNSLRFAPWETIMKHVVAVLKNTYEIQLTTLTAIKAGEYTLSCLLLRQQIPNSWYFSLWWIITPSPTGNSAHCEMRNIPLYFLQVSPGIHLSNSHE